MIQSKT